MARYMLSESTEKPMYQKIAIDIGNRIISGDFQIGEKIYGRSALASHYNVSPETIRRAIILLNDMKVVEVTKGSGIVIKSKDNCLKFIEKFKDIQSVGSLRKDIVETLKQKNNIEKSLNGLINKLMDYSSRLNKSNPFMPFEFDIQEGQSVIGKTIGETNFWQNTKATIIGIRRDGKLILSPGPFEIFKNGDTFVAIGKEESYSLIKSFLYKQEL